MQAGSEFSGATADVFSAPTMVDCSNTHSAERFGLPRRATVPELRTETVSHGPSGKLPTVRTRIARSGRRRAERARKMPAMPGLLRVTARRVARVAGGADCSIAYRTKRRERGIE